MKRSVKQAISRSRFVPKLKPLPTAGIFSSVWNTVDLGTNRERGLVLEFMGN
jgi:hypothetical protein